MRISILTQWYPPEPVYLMHELAQDIQALGHDVEVITGFPNYPSGELSSNYRLRPWMREEIDGIKVLRTWLYPDHSRSAIKRVANYLSFALSAMLAGPFLGQRPDVLFVYHPPLTVGLPGWLLSRFWRVPFVYQIQDMWPETLQATGMLNNKRILRAIARFARFIYRRADAICVISPGFKANLVEKGVPAHKIHVISNWVDQNTFFPATGDHDLAEKLELGDKFNVMFAGNIGEAQGLDTVLEAAERLRSLEEVQFVLVGDGIALPSLQGEAERRGLVNVRFLGRYPPTVMSRLYALADVLLVHLKNDPLFRITIPHKVFSYMASGKPILAAVDGDAADVVTEAGAGLACAPEDAAAMAQMIRRFYKMSATDRQKLGTRGLQAVEDNYSRTIVVNQLESLMASLVDGTGSRSVSIFQSHENPS